MLFPVCGGQASEKRSKRCSNIYRGRFHFLIISFYKYFAPLVLKTASYSFLWAVC